MHLNRQADDVVSAVHQLGREAPSRQPRLDEMMPLPPFPGRAEILPQLAARADAQLLVAGRAGRRRANAAGRLGEVLI